jgi:hypothetical protein
LDDHLPDAAQLWRPSAAEREDSIGAFFDPTWVAEFVSEAGAHYVSELERTLVGYADAAAQNADEFEDLLCAFEWPDPTSISEEVFGRLSAEAVEQLQDDMPPDLGGYDLGVAGLVTALGAARIVTSASCRGHSEPHSWAEYPVVYMAMDESQAAVLQPLVRRTGCGFQVDDARPQLVIVAACSVSDAMELGELVLDELQQFPD